jgi:hypothetical protein
MAALARGTMRVSMVEFIRRRGTRRNNLNVERQIDACQRVIRVQQNVGAFEADHRHDGRVAIFAGLERVAHFEFSFNGQETTIHPLNLVSIALAVGLRRRDHDAELCRGLGSAELFVESVNDLARAFEVRHRVAASGRVDHAVSGIAKSVVKGNNAAGHGAEGESARNRKPCAKKGTKKVQPLSSSSLTGSHHVS